jgi:hypothetical protein
MPRATSAAARPTRPSDSSPGSSGGSKASTGTRPSTGSKSTGTRTAPAKRPATATRPRSSAVARARKAKRTSSWWWAVALAAVVAIGGVAVFASGGGSGGSTASSTGSTGPVLAPADANLSGKTIDGMSCLGTEQLAFHDHAHLAVFVNGAQRTVPEFIGIKPDGSCLYWLHSHTPDGVIHMESPEQRSFTLGNYFDVWGQPLSASQVGPVKGTVTAFVDGKQVTGNPRDIKLGEHVNIQLDVGKVVPFKSYTYGEGL